MSADGFQVSGESGRVAEVREDGVLVFDSNRRARVTLHDYGHIGVESEDGLQRIAVSADKLTVYDAYTRPQAEIGLRGVVLYNDRGGVCKRIKCRR